MTMDPTMSYIQAYLGGFFDPDYEISDNEPDSEDLSEYLGETTKASTFIDKNSVILYKHLDELMDDSYESVRPWTSLEVRNTILREVPKSKHNIIFKLFYEGLGFHPNDGPQDGALHFAVLKMIQQYLIVYQNFTNSSFRPLHLALDIVLKHKNQLSSEHFRSMGFCTEGEDSFGPNSPDFKFHAAVKMTNYLLETGADPNELDENGKTALHRIADHLKRFLNWVLASSSDSSYLTANMLFVLLLRHGAEVNAEYENPEDDPFRIGLSYGSRTIVQLLIEHGYDLKKCSPKIFPPRTCMSWFGLFELLARANVLDVEAKDKEDGLTLLSIVLYHAVSKSLLGEVEALVENGSDVNAVDKCGSGVLAKAASLLQRKPEFDLQTYTKILRLLISRGAKVWDEFQPWLQQPLRAVLYRGPWEALQLFLDETTDNHFTLDGLRSINPLPTAARNKNREVFEKLLFEYKCDPEMKNSHGDVTLHLAVGCEDDEEDDYISAAKHYVDILLARGFDINCLNNYNDTPLHYAAERNSDMVQYLLSKGADINIRSTDGESPLDIALKWRKGTIARIIVAHIALLEKQGLHIDPEIFNRIRNAYTLREYYQGCKEELELIQDSFLQGSSISFYDILTSKKTLMRHLASRASVQRVCQSQDLQNRFPIYGQQMNQRVADARREVELLPGALAGLSRIFKSGANAFHLVYNNIVSHLCELDLSNLGKI